MQMKTREFIKQVEELGYLVTYDRGWDAIRIYKKDDLFCWIHISTTSQERSDLSHNKDRFEDKVMKLVEEYINTPVNKRFDIYYFVEMPRLKRTVFGGDKKPLYLTYYPKKDIWDIDIELGEKRTEEAYQVFLYEEIPTEYKEFAEEIMYYNEV